MTKALIVSTVVSVLLLFIAWGKIETLNVKVGGLEVKLVTSEAKVKNFQKLAVDQHKVIMANTAIDKKVKDKLDADYKKFEDLYSGSGSVITP